MCSAIRLVTVFFFVFITITACSKDESITEKASKKVDQITTKAADKAVKKIKTPIDKAKLTKTLGEDRLKAIDKSMQNQ